MSHNDHQKTPQSEEGAFGGFSFIVICSRGRGTPKNLASILGFFPVRMKIHQATVWQSEHVCLGATVDLSICDMYGILVPHFIKYLHFITVQTVCFDYGNLWYICLQLALQGLSVGWDYEKKSLSWIYFPWHGPFWADEKKNQAKSWSNSNFNWFNCLTTHWLVRACA